MFKLIILITLGVSWIGLCIESTGPIAAESKITKNIVIEPIESGRDVETGDEVIRAKRGQNEPTLALLLTYHGNNCPSKQKASTSKFETIHITNGGITRKVPPNNFLDNKLLESIAHTTSQSYSSDEESVHKNSRGEQSIQHKYQELLDQIDCHGRSEKCGCCGLNMVSCKNRNQQYVQLVNNVGPAHPIEKYTSVIESIGSESSQSADQDHRHNSRHHHGHLHHNDHDGDSASYTDEDDSNLVSFSISGDSDESVETFETWDKISASREHVTRPPPPHTNSVKIRPKFYSKRHTDKSITGKSQPRILAGPHIKLKSKHFPYHSRLKPLFIETGYSDSAESLGSHSHDSLYSNEASLEFPIETEGRGSKYKSDTIR